jgi:hypothetical protein
MNEDMRHFFISRDFFRCKNIIPKDLEFSLRKCVSTNKPGLPDFCFAQHTKVGGGEYDQMTTKYTE